MTLGIGTKLGPYEILAPLGAGGMGEVWRAKDTRLGRDVAIKVLPASFSADADRLRRFEQEARAAGILNHPNVTAVLDIGAHEGAPYVVQELLEGETLRGALSAGKISPRKAVDWALQIAHGLAAAHEKGIVHRDLKPENIFVTRDGRVKILDFGLAKLTQPEEPGNVTNVPTAAQGTEPGVVMGTIGYMSPEQVKGRPADARSDIFSFGAIFYEVLSGRRAFHGDSAAETISAILREDPPDLSTTNRSISPGLERIVRHCLEKNPEQRFHSAHDLAFDLEALSGLSTPRAGPPVLEGRASRLPAQAALAASVAALLVGIGAGWLIFRTRPVLPPTFKRLTYRRGPILSARFASDGQTVVYSALWDGAQTPRLYSTRAESPESLPLALPEGYDVAAVSRSGEMLILKILRRSTGYAAVGTLAQTPLSGSAPRELLEDVGHADWSPDGSSLAVTRAPEGRYRLEYPAGKVLYETTGWISFPRISPKGDTVAFFDGPLLGDDRGAVAIVDRAGKRRKLTRDFESANGLAWSADGGEIWFTASETGSSRSLRAVTPSGRERLVATTPSGMILQDISRDGRVLFLQTNARLGILALLPGEAKERDLSGLDWSWGPFLSADGKTMFYTEQGEGGGPGYSVYMRKLDGSSAVRLGEGQATAISPDGKWVLAERIRSTPVPFVLLPTGAGEPRTFPKDSIDHLSGRFFPDGKRILFRGHEPGRPPRMFVQDLEGGAAKPVTPEGVRASVLTPDGKSLVIQTEDEAALTPLEGGASRPIPGLERADRPLRFTPDGRFLYVQPDVRTFPVRVLRVNLATGQREAWKEVTPGDPTGISVFTATDISEDGRTIVIGYNHSLSELYLAEGFK